MNAGDPSSPSAAAKMWGGRFRKPPDPCFEQLNESLSCDGRLLEEDLILNHAWAEALLGAGILRTEECGHLQQALTELREEWHGRRPPALAAEDVHSFVEACLVEKVGTLGYRIHTGRSRNDQVATDTRMYVRKEILRLRQHLAKMVQELLCLADAAFDIPMPGFTHLQRAQPLLFSHYLLSFEVMLDRDDRRFSHALQGLDSMPLGSGALSGCAFPIDRQALADRLGFSSISRNSLDAVSDRDFLCDVLYAAAMTMVHLSRLATDFILFSSKEFDFLQMGDSVTTGSSLMPQKRNPDAMELIRGKASTMESRLFSLLSLLRGLPSGYNKDLQEDKSAVFAALDELGLILQVTRRVLADTTLHPDCLRRAAADSFPLATDLADYLVFKDVPFRQAHHIVGNLVNYALEKSKELTDLTPEEFQQFSECFQADVLEWLSLDFCLSRRKLCGGTAPIRVSQALEEAHQRWQSRMVAEGQ